MKTLAMRKEYHQRLLRGHLWGWRNDFEPEDLARVAPGEVIRVVSSDGAFIGTGFANPNSHIAFRLVRREDAPIDQDFFRNRLDQALNWREQVRRGCPVRRLVFGESDGLPGLVVDQYETAIVLSQSVFGMESWTDFVVEHLVRRLEPGTVILKNRNLLRRLEGLPLDTSVVYGTWEGPVAVEYDGFQVMVDCCGGRKTGLFLDHRENRRLLQQMITPGADVLDLFSHCGLWGLSALSAGAGTLVCVDNDASVTELGRRSGQLNNWAERIEFVQQDVREYLVSAPERLFDIVILDPPAFAKKKRYLKDALVAYGEYNGLALDRLKPGGLLVSSSCSSFVARDMLTKRILDGARETGRHLQLVAEGGQALDHPVLLAMPETGYLKCLFFREIR
jgi:23S rRNA (cytosine1962-C5)-methyltransferase